jgi:hypothetical protein
MHSDYSTVDEKTQNGGGEDVGVISEHTEIALIDVSAVDRLFLPASLLAVSVYIALLALVYNMTPREEWVYLEGVESNVPAAVSCMLLCSILLSLTPLLVVQSLPRAGTSGIFWCNMTIQCISLSTNALMAWGPSVVKEDPVTLARVHFIRWCEWVPLSGLMTFMAESVDLPKGPGLMVVPVLASLSQSLSCLCAMVFPFCKTVWGWCFVMFVSMVTYMAIFPRVYSKRRQFRSFLITSPASFEDSEKYHRFKFAYHLMVTCSIVWTVLVVLYFLNMLGNYALPETHIFRHPALPMVLDTFFDFLAKVVYNMAILEVHRAVFDSERLSRHQLFELRSKMAVLWSSSSDAMIISGRKGHKFTTMISPTFTTMMAGANEFKKTSIKEQGLFDMSTRTSLLIETYAKDIFVENAEIRSKVFVVDSTALDYAYNSGADGPESGFAMEILDLQSSTHQHWVRQAEKIIMAAWKVKHPTFGSSSNIDSHESNASRIHQEKVESFMMCDVATTNGTTLKCELKINSHSDSNVIVTLRDVTERYRRLGAERRAYAESLARQKDAQAVNSFTRHEVKNGLLAGVALCDTLRNLSTFSSHETGSRAIGAQAEIDTASPAGQNKQQLAGENDVAALNESSRQARVLKNINDLDFSLHSILDTILAEAMARDVVHEVYRPKLERVDVREVLTASFFGNGNTNNSDGQQREDRFEIRISPPTMPFLLMDPQLLMYIHRNAVSNAAKYGKAGGRILTDVRYLAATKGFEMDIINEPGDNHEELLSMGVSACQAVFAQGTRLNNSKNDQLSSGDGAWIIQKCAKTLGGMCQIQFDRTHTSFFFRCPVKPYSLPWQADEQFEVPPGTWGVAIDDSSIQRKLMARILLHAGVGESKIIVLGESPSDVTERFEEAIRGILDNDASSPKILIMVDENLDYRSIREFTQHSRYSGSKYMEAILKKMSPAEESRVLALVRSANDSADDIASYKERTHGFFPKSSMRREKVREILAHLWYNQFLGKKQDVDNLTNMDFDGEELVTRGELLASLNVVESLLERSTSVTWGALRGALFTLKGDLMVLEDSEEIDRALELIESMRGDDKPKDFGSKWDQVHRIIFDQANKMN